MKGIRKMKRIATCFLAIVFLMSNVSQTVYASDIPEGTDQVMDEASVPMVVETPQTTSSSVVKMIPTINDNTHNPSNAGRILWEDGNVYDLPQEFEILDNGENYHYTLYSTKGYQLGMGSNQGSLSYKEIMDDVMIEYIKVEDIQGFYQMKNSVAMKQYPFYNSKGQFIHGNNNPYKGDVLEADLASPEGQVIYVDPTQGLNQASFKLELEVIDGDSNHVNPDKVLRNLQLYTDTKGVTFDIDHTACGNSNNFTLDVDDGVVGVDVTVSNPVFFNEITINLLDMGNFNGWSASELDAVTLEIKPYRVVQVVGEVDGDIDEFNEDDEFGYFEYKGKNYPYGTTFKLPWEMSEMVIHPYSHLGYSLPLFEDESTYPADSVKEIIVNFDHEKVDPMELEPLSVVVEYVSRAEINAFSLLYYIYWNKPKVETLNRNAVPHYNVNRTHGNKFSIRPNELGVLVGNHYQGDYLQGSLSLHSNGDNNTIVVPYDNESGEVTFQLKVESLDGDHHMGTLNKTLRNLQLHFDDSLFQQLKRVELDEFVQNQSIFNFHVNKDEPKLINVTYKLPDDYDGEELTGTFTLYDFADFKDPNGQNNSKQWCAAQLDELTFKIVKEASHILTPLPPEGEGAIKNSETGVLLTMPKKYSVGTAVRLAAEPADGYRFHEWSIYSEKEDDEWISPEIVDDDPVVIVMDQDKAIRAHFKRVFKLTTQVVESGEGQIVYASSGDEVQSGTEFEPEKNIKLKGVANQGYRLEKWEVSQLNEDNQWVMIKEQFVPKGATDEALTVEVSMDNDTKVIAYFKNIYELETETVGNGTVMLDGGSVSQETPVMWDENENLALRALPHSGWIFDQWKISEVKEDQVQVVTVLDEELLNIKMDNNKKVVAYFKQLHMLTTLIDGQGKIASSEGTEVNKEWPHGHEITLKAKPAAGHYFVNWKISQVIDGQIIDEVKTASEIIITMDRDKTVTAIFQKEDEPEPTKYNLTANTIGEGIIKYQGIQDVIDHVTPWVKGSIVKLEASASEDYRFDKWVISEVVDGEEKQEIFTTTDIDITMDNDKEVVAYFNQIEKRQLRAKVEVGEGQIFNKETDEELNPITQWEKGLMVKLLTKPANGYIFEKWIVSELIDDEVMMNEYKTPSLELVMNADTVALAYFTKVYELTTKVQGEGSIAYTDQDKVVETSTIWEAGSYVDLTATPSPEWSFSHWKLTYMNNEDGVSGLSVSDKFIWTNKIIIEMDGDQEALAVFTKEDNPPPEPPDPTQYYRLKIKIKGKGAVTSEPQRNRYVSGKKVVLLPEPASGWVFDKFEEESVGSKDGLYYLYMTKNKEITAVFKEEEPTGPFKLTIDILGKGKVAVTPEKELYEPRDMIEVEAIPADGWRFVRWEETIPESNRFIYFWGKDIFLRAVFEEMPKSPEEPPKEEETTPVLNVPVDNGEKHPQTGGTYPILPPYAILESEGIKLRNKQK